MQNDQDFKQNSPEIENQDSITLIDIQKQIANQTDFFTTQINQLESQIQNIIASDQNHKQNYIQRIQQLEEEKLVQKLKLGLAKRDIKKLHQKNQRLEKIVRKLSPYGTKKPLQPSQTSSKKDNNISVTKTTRKSPPINQALTFDESKIADFSSFQFETVTVNEEGIITERIESSAKYRQESLDNDVNLDMIFIPGGNFLMGTDTTQIKELCRKYCSDWPKYEQPQHEVSVKPFLMAKYPVTQAQWRVIALRKDLKYKLDLNPEASFYKGNNLPVEKVSWHHAQEYCLRLSRLTGKKYRLPSEAEWEYACRAQTSTPFYFGETITTDLANFNGNYTYGLAKKGAYRARTTEVGIFYPNAFGLYDLHGNVWEWCADSWHESYEDAPIDGSSWVDDKNNIGQKVLRGGSWYYDPLGCRSAYRFNYASDDFYDLIGFRPVCELD